MKKLSIAVIFMGALATSSFAADEQQTDRQSVTLYSKVQKANVKGHVIELSQELRDFLDKQQQPVEDHSSDYWFSGVRNALSWGMRAVGDTCRQSAASSMLGELAVEHVKAYLAQQNGSSSSLTAYMASWDSAAAWKVTGAAARTAGYLIGTKTKEELALEEGALYRIIFNFCEDKKIGVTAKDVLPLAATALMLCEDKMGQSGGDQIRSEYKRLVLNFSEKASLEPLANAVVAIDYLVEGICNYELLKFFLDGKEKALESLIEDVKQDLAAWEIDPLTMLSCTACIDKNSLLTQGMTEQAIREMPLNKIDEKINEIRKIKIKEFAQGLFTKHVNRIAFNNRENLYFNSNENMKALQKSLNSSQQLAIQ